MRSAARPTRQPGRSRPHPPKPKGLQEAWLEAGPRLADRLYWAPSCPPGTRTVREHLRAGGQILRTWPLSPSCSPASRGPCPREPRPSSADRPGRYDSLDRPAPRRRHRPHLRSGRPDPARRLSRRTVRHHRQGPLTPAPEPGRGGTRLARRRKQSTRRGQRLSTGGDQACPETAAHGDLTRPRGLEHGNRGDLPGSGKSCNKGNTSGMRALGYSSACSVSGQPSGPRIAERRMQGDSTRTCGCRLSDTASRPARAARTHDPW